MTKEQLIKFWINSSDRDVKAMHHLNEKGDYSWSLFIGHLVLEKLLKACYVKQIDDSPPLTHNLSLLAERAKLELTDRQRDLLITVTTFNIQARYNDYKLAFYKTCTKNFTKKWIEKIEEFREWIKQQLSTS